MVVSRTSRRVAIVVVSVLVVAAVAAGLIWYLAPRGDSTATDAPPTVAIVDPPVVEAPPKIIPQPPSDKAPTPAGILAQLAPLLANPALAQFSGIVIDPAANNFTLWNKDSNAPQLPASTAKLLTGAALLTSVDPTSRFVTKVVRGDQEGDIVLVGGGDVTLSARNEGVGTVYEGAPLMSDLAAQVKASGVDVKRIVLDTEYWSGPDLADGWQTSDIRGTPASAQGYITRMSPLMVDGDREDPANENSIRTGDPDPDRRQGARPAARHAGPAAGRRHRARGGRR